MTGLILVLAVSFAYIFANVAVFRLYWTEHPETSSTWILHCRVPGRSTLVLLYAIYGRSRWPRPSTSHPIVDGLWLLHQELASSSTCVPVGTRTGSRRPGSGWGQSV